MSTQCIKVIAGEDKEPVDVPCEEDGTILLTTLASILPDACGLKYRNLESGALRGLRVLDGKILPPEDKGWPLVDVYLCTFTATPTTEKRKLKEEEEEEEDEVQILEVDASNPKPSSNKKPKRPKPDPRCTDLFVGGLSFSTSERTMREYFERLGDLAMAEVKTDPHSGRPRGFGFVRFLDYETQLSALKQKRHFIDNRWVDVVLTNKATKLPDPAATSTSSTRHHRVFIGNITRDITTGDLEEYFRKFGSIEDVWIPQKYFRRFAFITFGGKLAEVPEEDGGPLYGYHHMIKGIHLEVKEASPRPGLMQQKSSAVVEQRHQDPIDIYSTSGYSANFQYDSPAASMACYYLPPQPQSMTSYSHHTSSSYSPSTLQQNPNSLYSSDSFAYDRGYSTYY